MPAPSKASGFAAEARQPPTNAPSTGSHVGRLGAYHQAVLLAAESFVVFLAASLAAGAMTAAYNYLVEREWPAVVFLTLAATATVWYGIILLTVVRAVFSA